MTCPNCKPGVKCMGCELKEMGVVFKEDLDVLKKDAEGVPPKPEQQPEPRRVGLDDVVNHLRSDCNNPECVLHKARFDIEAEAYEMGFATGAKVK